MFTAAMRHLTAVVLRRDAEAVSRALLRIGVLDFVRLESDSLSRMEEPAATSRLTELRTRIENLASPMESPLSAGVTLAVDDAEPVDLDAVEKELDHIAGRLQEIRNRQREVNQEILKLEDLQRRIALYPDLKESDASSLLVTMTGSLPSEGLKEAERRLAGFPAVSLAFDEASGRVPLLLIGLKRDRRDLSRILDEKGWIAEELPAHSGAQRDELRANLHTKIDALRTTQKNLAGQYTGEIDGRADWFRRQWAALTVSERLKEVISNFSRTERSVLFSGWVPEEERTGIERALGECTAGRYYLEWHAPEEVGVEAPVKLNNPGFLKPFQMLVENYAIPEYASIDPTPLVAVSFLAMFGLMFADAGQGLVLLLLGILVPRFHRGLSVGMRRLFTLIAYCGAAAVVSGVLFGSYFGRAWLPPLWFNYHALIAGHESGNPAVRSVYDILAITIWFGIVILGLGLALNWINLINKRRFLDLLFHKAGLFGGWIYFCGIYTAFYFVRRDYASLPDGGFLAIAFGIPAAALFFKHPLAARGEPSGAHGSGLTLGTLVTYLMEWIVELLEIFSGYLANTLSFMRVAGLGIAHVSLMLAFDQIAELAGTAAGGYSVWSILILILGNLLVLVLEGLSAGIQALRLNYYEFFSKYFTDSGKAYAPISLRNKT